jgi:murein DD-endopeptidase MepM/ murein hydrolase activator NlpD
MRTNALDGLSLPPLPLAEGAAVDRSAGAQDAGASFEAYLVSFMFRQIRESDPDGLLNSGAMATFGGLFDQELGKAVAAGEGLGLRQELARAMAEQEVGSALPTPRRQEGVARITSDFGARRDPFTGAARAHHGTDIGAPLGSEVRAVQSGRVIFAGDRGGLGHAVIVDHGGGLQTVYGHCGELRVREGDEVAAGATLAEVGMTGRTTGPHLHFEVRLHGEALDPASHFDPLSIVDPLGAGPRR